MPKIETLVEDIYKILVSKEFEIDADNLAKTIKNRLEQKQGGGTLRMSSIGQDCERKTWYSVNKPEVAEGHSGPTYLKFLLGDIIEEVVLSLAKAAGHDVRGEQDTLDVAGIKGHRDALIDGMLIDVKSANSRSFDKFKYHQLKKGNDPFAYLTQLSLYHYASDDKEVDGEAAYLAVDKELGHIILDKHKQDVNFDWKKFVEDKKEMVARPVPPGRHYSPVADGKSGNMVIPMECKYCAFKDTCYQDINGGRGLRKVVFANGPRWFTVVRKEPAPKVRF